MYNEEYKRWMAADLEDADLKPELSKIEGNDEEIKDRFAVALKFGTAGLRGVLGAGTNRMNIYVVRQATQGLANWVKTQGGTQTVAISYDSRLKSDIFAKTAAGVLAANDIKVRIYDALMPVPALSFATRYYECNAGIMVTASHNPAKYNGYKAYGPDGCQMTDDAAAIVYDEIQKTDVLTGAKYMSFAEGVEEGLIRFVGDDCKRALYDAIESRQVRPGLCKTAGLKLVYSPLNGSGLVPVTQILKDIGITDVTIVPEQEYPNGYFTTCSYPNPEIFAALEQGLKLAKETGADLMLATDPDADRVGIAMKCPDGSYELVSGNEVGVLLLDYIAAGRIEKGTMPKNPVAVKSIVSTPLADAVAEHYGVELRSVLTGFKWIGDQIAQLEAAGEVDRFIFGFEESYGYLAGPYVRDKDAIIGSMLICEMAAYYRSIGSSLKQRLEEIYAQYGRYLNKVDSFEFPGLSGMDTMAGIMQKFRDNPPADIAGYKVVKVTDYKKPEETGLPAANVLIYKLENNETVVVRPSGTEPKIKIYYTTLGKDLAEAEAENAVTPEVQDTDGLSEEDKTLYRQAKYAAKQYDYDKAISMLQNSETYQTSEKFQHAVKVYQKKKESCVSWPLDQVTHVFYHTLIKDTGKAFDGDYKSGDYDQVMTTIDEFNQITQSMYDKGYVMVSIYDMATADENGNMNAGEILLPPGKVPFVLSQDDVCYYHYMDGDGFATKLIVDEEGKIRNEYVEDDGSISVGDYDMVPLIDRFVEEHPDFSYRGAKGIVALTGYNGILGYRTDSSYETRPDDLDADKVKWLDEHPDFNLNTERENAARVAQAMKDEGWLFASHTWGHQNVSQISLERLQADTQKFKENVDPLIGGTDIIIFAFGADLTSVEDYSGEKFEYLKSQGYNYYCNVDSSQYFVQIRSNYFRQGRRNLDGYRMYYNPELLSDLFDAQSVFDSSRPVPVPTMG